MFQLAYSFSAAIFLIKTELYHQIVIEWQLSKHSRWASCSVSNYTKPLQKRAFTQKWHQNSVTNIPRKLSKIHIFEICLDQAADHRHNVSWQAVKLPVKASTMFNQQTHKVFINAYLCKS